MKLTTEEWTRKVNKYLEEHPLCLLKQLEISTGIKAFVHRYDEDYYDSEMLTKEEYYHVFENFLYEKYSNEVYNKNDFGYIISCVHDYEETLALMKEVLEECYPTKEINVLIGSNETEYILNKLEEDKDCAFKLADDYSIVMSKLGIKSLLRQLEHTIEERYKLIKTFNGLKNYQEYNQLAEENNWGLTFDKLTYVLVYSEHSAKLIDFLKKVNKKTSLKSLGIEVIFEY